MTILLSAVMLLLAHMVQAYPFPGYNGKRYTRGSYRPAYIPLPFPYSLPQTFEDLQEDNAQSFVPYYYYNPYRTDRRIRYVVNPSSQLSNSERTDQSAYPFGQEMWYEGSNDDELTPAASAAATREAILQNLIIAQMYEDAAANAAVSGFPFYQVPIEDYENKDWKYGVPTTGIDEKEKAREFLKHEEDEEVKELENLHKSKEGRRRRKQKAKEGKADTKQTQELRESLGLVKRQEPLQATSRPLLTEATLAEQAVLSGRKALGDGQKEQVQLQPPRPARKPFADLTQRLHSRSSEPSVYQTIKQLLAMENDYRKTDDSRLQKRFISTEEQLTEQLRGLKKPTI